MSPRFPASSKRPNVPLLSTDQPHLNKFSMNLLIIPCTSSRRLSAHDGTLGQIWQEQTLPVHINTIFGWKKVAEFTGSSLPAFSGRPQ